LFFGGVAPLSLVDDDGFDDLLKSSALKLSLDVRGEDVRGEDVGAIVN
jgi:hypothetical protein